MKYKAIADVVIPEWIKKYLRKKLHILSPSIACLQSAEYFFFGKEPTEEYKEIVDLMVSHYGIDAYIVKGCIIAAQEIKERQDNKEE